MTTKQNSTILLRILAEHKSHYSDVIMSAIASQVTSLTIVYSSDNFGADLKKHQRCGEFTSNAENISIWWRHHVQYISRNMHTVFALLCFVVVIHWLIFPYRSGLLHWHCGNLTIAPVSAKQLWWIWINTSCEFIMNDRITTPKQSTTKPCAYFLGYTVLQNRK